MNPPDERGAELRELFFETSQELLQALNEESLKLEKNPGDEEIVRSIRRTVHTLKGDSAACGLRELSELAHQFEDALSLEGTAAHGALAEIALAAADVFAEMLAAYHGGGPLPATESLRQRINELTAAPAAKKARRKKTSTEPAPRSNKDWTDAERLPAGPAPGAGLYDVVVKIDPLCAMPIAARHLIQNAIKQVGQVLVVRPDAKSAAASKQVEFVFASLQTKEQIAAKCHIPTIAGDIHVTLIQAASVKASTKVAEKSAPDLEAAAATIAPSDARDSGTQVSVTPSPTQPVPTEAQAPAA